jgi:hypothetical protein
VREPRRRASANEPPVPTAEELERLVGPEPAEESAA